MKDPIDLSKFPSKSQYKNSCKGIFFSYSPNNTNFQQGYLGIQQTKITGILHIRRPPTNPLLTDKIEIIFTGKEFVRWSEIDMSSSIKKNLIELSYIIWESPIKGVCQKITELDLPFEIPLPDYLPASLLFQIPIKAKISYILKAKISLKPTLLPIPMIRTSIPTLKGVEYEVNLDQTIFGIGNSIIIPINLMLENMKVYVKKIQIYLKEYHQVMQKKIAHYDAREVVKTEIFGDQLMLVSSVHSDHIVIWHKVKVKINLKDAPEIKFEKEVKVVNTLCEEDASAITEERRRSNWSKMDKLSAKAVYNLLIN